MAFLWCFVLVAELNYFVAASTSCFLLYTLVILECLFVFFIATVSLAFVDESCFPNILGCVRVQVTLAVIIPVIFRACINFSTREKLT